MVSWAPGWRDRKTRRLQYEVLHRIIYRDSYTIEVHKYLSELGLFAVIDAPSIPEDRPEIEFNPETYGSGVPLKEIDELDYGIGIGTGTAIGVCLVCHRAVVLLANDYPFHNLESITFERYINWLPYKQMVPILGHLARHFYLEVPWSTAHLSGPKNRFPDKFGSFALGRDIINDIYEWHLDGLRPMIPVVHGKPMDIEEARRWWNGLLSGRKSSYPK